MSTKIYYGFKFHQTSTIGGVSLRLKNIKKDATLYCQSTIEEWLKTHDRNELYDLMTKAEKSIYGGSIFDLKLSITIFHHKNEFYGIPFADDGKLIEIVLKNKWVRDFSYWNNSDQPEGMSDKEWEMRAKVWNDIFKKEGTPSEAGYTKDIILNPVLFLYH